MISDGLSLVVYFPSLVVWGKNLRTSIMFSSFLSYIPLLKNSKKYHTLFGRLQYNE